MSSFRERLKINKNKSYKSLVKESQTKSVDRDLMSSPQSIPELERVDLPQDLSVIAEEGEEPSIAESKVNISTPGEVDRDVEDISRPHESKVSRTKKPSKIKTKMTLPDGVESKVMSSKTKKTKKSKKTRAKKQIESVELEIPASMIQVDDNP